MKLPRLLALTPGNLESGRDASLLRRLEEALEAGLPGVLVREARLSDREFVRLVEALRELAAAASSEPWVALHDRVHLVRALEVQAVHLGFRSLQPKVVKEAFGSELCCGLSTHAGDDPGSFAGADYLFHGPVHPTPSKAGLVAPVGFAGLAQAVHGSERPVFAIGGLLPDDVAPTIEAGAHGVAVLSGILGREDAGAATESYLRAFTAAVPTAHA